MNNFRFLIEYPFELIFSMMDVYSDPQSMSSENCLMHGYCDIEKVDRNHHFPIHLKEDLWNS